MLSLYVVLFFNIFWKGLLTFIVPGFYIFIKLSPLVVSYACSILQKRRLDRSTLIYLTETPLKLGAEVTL